MSYSESNSIIRFYFSGSRCLSNVFWTLVVGLGGLSFFVTGLSSFFEVNLLPFSDYNKLLFIPQGLVLIFYGTLGLILGIFLSLNVWWDVGSGYNEYNKFVTTQKKEEKNKNKNNIDESLNKSNNKSNNKSQNNSKNSSNNKSFSNKHKKELEKLPNLIEKLESQKQDIYNQLNDPELYKTNPEKMQSLQNQMNILDQEIKDKYDRWEELENS